MTGGNRDRGKNVQEEECLDTNFGLCPSILSQFTILQPQIAKIH